MATFDAISRQWIQLRMSTCIDRFVPKPLGKMLWIYFVRRPLRSRSWKNFPVNS